MRFRNQDHKNKFKFTHSVFQPIIQTVQKWAQCIPMVLFTCDVKNIKGATDINGLKNATCKRTLSQQSQVLELSRVEMLSFEKEAYIVATCIPPRWNIGLSKIWSIWLYLVPTRDLTLMRNYASQLICGISAYPMWLMVMLHWGWL